ncbi:histidinol dehydrogenase, partial [Salinicoccus roseus]|uniref:histidinol dehydrogenase n=1 Tax=Salinicoccus roseus TaxID=45670 RepID=UPI001CA62BE1
AQEFREIFDQKRAGAGFDGYKDLMDIIECVRTEGDAALLDYTEKFAGRKPESFKVPASALKASYDAISDEEKTALETIRTRIER